MAEPGWEGLSGAQADGRACVVCGRGFRVRGSVAVPVRRAHTGSQVFACAGACASTATQLAAGSAAGGELVIPDEALTARGGR